jgi:RNA polymerase sigma-70 factor (ECF subfamily)
MTAPRAHRTPSLRTLGPEVFNPAHGRCADDPLAAPAHRPVRAVPPTALPDAVAEAADVADRDVFAAVVARHRRELYVHCVGILNSPEQAEDALQETLLRAWRSRAGFAGRSSVRTWLYRIATNACMDEIRRDESRSHRQRQPRLVVLDDEAQLPPGATTSPIPEPDATAEARDALELAFRAVIRLLPPRQRAALILCDVMRFRAAEAAVLLDASVAAVNSALQRARATLSEEGPDRDGAGRPTVCPRPAERALLNAYVDAVRRSDIPRMMALVQADAAPRRAVSA